jgi:molybdate transport system substrate-binding protein
MQRRSFFGSLLVGLAGGPLGAGNLAAQHHGLQPPSGPADGRSLLVFAAATLKPALDAIVAAYRTKQGGEITIAYGPTPALAKQIENGAPADIFLAADPVWMDYLAEKRLIRRHTRADLVRNVLVLAGHGSRPAATSVTIDSNYPLAQVVGSGPLCMCNPADHPAGRYGKASLETLGLWDSVAAKVAIVDNPQIAAIMVGRGDAPAAVVFATDVRGVAGATVLGTFPEASHPPIVYPAAVTMAAPRAAEAERLLAYLRSPEARTLFDDQGYT